MNVKELKEALNNLPDDMEVIMQMDAEGNGYSPLRGADPQGIYVPDSTYAGEVYDAKWSASDAAMEKEEWQEMLKRPRALILFPIN